MWMDAGALAEFLSRYNVARIATSREQPRSHRCKLVGLERLRRMRHLRYVVHTKNHFTSCAFVLQRKRLAAAFDARAALCARNVLNLG